MADTAKRRAGVKIIMNSQGAANLDAPHPFAPSISIPWRVIIARSPLPAALSDNTNNEAVYHSGDALHAIGSFFQLNKEQNILDNRQGKAHALTTAIVSQQLI